MNLATGRGGNVPNAMLRLVQFEKSTTTSLVRMLAFFHVSHMVGLLFFIEMDNTQRQDHTVL
jgi:hypothetical protein